MELNGTKYLEVSTINTYRMSECCHIPHLHN